MCLLSVSVSDDPDSETWELVLSGTLEDTRQGTDPLPILQLDLDVPVVQKQFIKFDVISFYGKGGCLEYFDIVRDTGPRMKAALKRECTRKSGDCSPLPQFCSDRACISDTVKWADISTPSLVRQGCSFSAGDVYFADVTQPTCISKKAVKSNIKVVDGVFLVDTTETSNLLPCSHWNETDDCGRQYVEVKKRQEAVSDLSTFNFKLSSENCPDKSRVSLEVVEVGDTATDFNLTGRFLSYKSVPDHLVEVGSGEKCFTMKHNLCGPNSLSFFNKKKDLVVTNCQGTLLMRPELDSCGSDGKKLVFLQTFRFYFCI